MLDESQGERKERERERKMFNLNQYKRNYNVQFMMCGPQRVYLLSAAVFCYSGASSTGTHSGQAVLGVSSSVICTDFERSTYSEETCPCSSALGGLS